LKWQAITHPDDVERDQKIFNSILSGEKVTARWEKRYLHKNGSIVWVDISTSLERETNNKSHYFITTIYDITERKRWEERLLVSETRYRRLFETAKDGILILDAETGIIVDVNPFLMELLGFSYEEFLGKSIWDVGFFKDIAQNENKFFELQQKGYVRYDNLPMESTDGRKIDVEFVSNIYLVNNTKVIQCNIRDITKRKRAEKELSTLVHALRSISECVSITDMNDIVLFVNEAFLKTYGYQEHELMGKNVNIVRSSNNPSTVMSEILPATLRGGWRGEILNRRKDGSEFPISLSTSVIRDDKGRPLALIGVAVDVTTSRIAEEKRKSLESQLQQAQKLESLGTLASGIAHDFNNILGIIIGHASLLEQLPPDPVIIKKNTGAITKAGMRGAALVKQLLTFARKTDILVESVRLNDIVVEVSNLLGETFPKTITISLELEKQLPSITADATQVHQVILNLCVNARDAMPNGGTISITTFVIQGARIRSRFHKADAKEYVGLRLSDTGIGMDEATRLRMFEPFFTTKGVGKGTGLGLSLVFGIVESHKGFIDVRSEPGNGTTFEVYFPLPLQFIKAAEVEEQFTGIIPGGTETLLLVEDEELLRGMVKEILIAKGYTVLTAKDGKEGIEQYQRHQKEIQLVISDFGLPMLSGFEEFKRMKTISPDVKFILATGFIDSENKSEMLKAGIKEILQKPYSIEKVLRSVRDIIDLK